MTTYKHESAACPVTPARWNQKNIVFPTKVCISIDIPAQEAQIMQSEMEGPEKIGNADGCRAQAGQVLEQAGHAATSGDAERWSNEYMNKVWDDS